MGLVAQLAHGLKHLGEPAAVHRVVVAEAAAIGVKGQPAGARDQVAVRDECPALALLAETEVLDRFQHRDGEAVIDGRIVDVARRDAGFLERLRAGPACAGIGQVHLAGHQVLRRFAAAEHLDAVALERGRDLGRHHHKRAAAVGDHAAVEPVQRVRDHRRVDHLVHRHDLAQHGVFVVLGVVRGGDLDPGELLAGSAEFVHVPARGHAVHVHHGGSVDELERHVGRSVAVIAGRRAGRHAL